MPPLPAPVLVIQHIVVEWYQHSRGAVGVGRRKVVPTTAPLPVQRIGPTRYNTVVHTLFFRDWRTPFQPTEMLTAAERASTQPYVYEAVTVTSEQDTLHIAYAYTHQTVGKPYRPWGSASLGALEADRWMCIGYSGRFTYEDIWAYRRQIVNVGFFTSLVADVFQQSAPQREYYQWMPS